MVIVVVVMVKSVVPAVPVVVVKVTSVSVVLDVSQAHREQAVGAFGDWWRVGHTDRWRVAGADGVGDALGRWGTQTALVGALKVTPKVSTGSPVVSLMVAVRTVTMVTPAGIVMMPWRGPG